MTQNVKLIEKKKKDGKQIIKETEVTLDFDKWYSGVKPQDENEKNVRKWLKLPVTKSLVYYSSTLNPDSKMEVIEYRICECNFSEMYQEYWATLEIKAKSETASKTVKIMSWFLHQMQSPTFFDDIKEESGE